MTDPLAEMITTLKLSAVLSKTVSGAGAWRVRRSDRGQSFYCALLEGACRLEIEGQASFTLHAGDFILIPAAYNFVMTSMTPLEPATLNTLPVAVSDGHFRLGNQHAPADMLALLGHCVATSPDAGLLVSLMPTFIVVHDKERLALLVRLLRDEAQAQRPGKDIILARLIELLFIEAIRSTGTQATPGLMRGLADARIAQAIRLIHQDPARRWTVKELARSCALSRSALFGRFTEITGVTPMGYLFSWRMTLAIQLLCRNEASITEVAERVGYGSASAFSVAFTRYTGVPPGKYAQTRPLQTDHSRHQDGQLFA
jgi:AraC-like DNA-binding protein